MFRRLAGALMILWPLTAIQAQTRTITMEEAVSLSLLHSPALKAKQAQIAERQAALQKAQDERLPDLKITGSYMRLNSANIDFKSSSGSGSGGESPKINQALYGLVNVSLPIYTGGRIKFGIESARYLAEAARLDAGTQKDEVIQNTIEAYINLYKAAAAVSLVEDNLKQAQQRVKDFSNLEKNGLLARNDLMKAELQASTTELALLDAQNSYQLAQVNMNLMLGLPEQTEIKTDSVLQTVPAQLNALNDYIQAAGSSRYDKAALSLQRKAADVEVKQTKSGRYPSLALTGGYIAADIPHFVTITNAVNIGLGVSYNIGSIWKGRASIKQAEAQSAQLAAQELGLDEKVRLQVNKAYLDCLSSKKKIDVYERSVDQANENYRITRNKYDNSLASTTDLLDADVAQLQAKLNYAFAKADALVTYYQLLKVTGQSANNFK